MSRRRRKSRRAQTPHKPSGSATTSKSAQTAPKPAKGVQSRSHQANTGANSETSQYAWVTVEHRDSDGNPTLPREWIASTYGRRYEEVPSDTEIEIHVLAGYKPKPVLMVERKIYEIHRLTIQGWRRSGQVAVEVDGWRHHEADWFNAMQGAKLHISDPGSPGPHNEETDYVISGSSFDRKIVTLLDEKGGKTEVQLHEGTLDIKESWKSAWGRQRAEVLNLGIKLLLVPLLVALGAGLTLWWVDRSPSSNGNDAETQGPPAQHGDQPADDGAGGVPLDGAANDQSLDTPAQDAASDTTVEPSNARRDTIVR